MDEKPEGGPNKPLKKKSGAPKVTNPSADPLVQPTVNPAPKPVSKPPVKNLAPKPVGQPLPRPVPKPMNTTPAKERVIAPSITSFAPARAHVNPASEVKPTTQTTDMVVKTPTTSVAAANDNKPIIKDVSAVKKSVEGAPATETSEPLSTPIEESTPIDIASIVEQPAKKSHKKLIIFTIIGCIVIALGALATFLTVTFLNVDNRVAAATIKLFNNEHPRYIQFNGKAENTFDDNGISTTNILNINSKFDYRTGAFQSDTSILLDAGTDNEFNYKISEIKDETGNYYINFSSIGDLITNLMNSVINGISSVAGSESLITNGTTTITEDLTVKVSQSIGDKWVQVSSAEAESMTETSFGGSQLTNCWAKALQSLPNLGANAKTLYEQNPFIAYSTENLKISAKANNLYRLSFNDEKMANFINSMPDKITAKNLLNCAGVASADNITAANVAKILPTSLTVYVEIDKDDNFTRLYVDYTEITGLTIKADIDITYPDNLTIVTPDESVTLNDFTSILIEAMKPEEPEEPEEPVDNGWWYDPNYYYDDTSSSVNDNDNNYYDEPAQELDPNGSGGNYNPGF